jgi:hypothetical protein
MRGKENQINDEQNAVQCKETVATRYGMTFYKLTSNQEPRPGREH